MTPDQFEPPETGAGRRRRRNRRILLALVVVLALGGTAWAVLPQWGGPEPCQGLDQTSGDGFALSRWTGTGGECVGWTVERDFPFGSPDPVAVSAIAKIVAENQAVRDQNTKPYIRVAVLMPMLARPGSAMTTEDIGTSLRGMYAAQMQANHSTALGDTTPLVQLVLANEGYDESAGPEVAGRLAALKDGDHPLVAAAGMGISDAHTRDTAARLGAEGIPSIGAAITADNMVDPWLFKVSPSNRDYVRALKAVLDNHSSTTALGGYLLYDRNADDYVRTLKAAFTETFDSEYSLSEHSSGFNGSKPPQGGTPLLFHDAVSDICTSNPDVLFYAGRGRDLPALIQALGERGRCQNPVRPLMLVTGTVGLAVNTGDLDAGTMGLLDATAADPGGWRAGGSGTPRAYAAFRTYFTTPQERGGLGFSEADLASGYAITHRDAVAAVVWAARRDANAKSDFNNHRAADTPAISELPTAADVRNALFSLKDNPVPGVSGELYFREQPPNDLWPYGRPVPVVPLGRLAGTWSIPGTYRTQ
ncbi:ABC transporter substrate-binding protein [Amycolatopsis pigmentata]|uniref:ABC transporter substrate-binding protein n=1 Tax=Amycolatopsis pigmentata TaxID=450801 RepID=A0ABW5G287_9PSEU